MIIKIDKPYLWLPVGKEAQEVKLQFYTKEKKVQEIDIHLGTADCDFYSCWEVKDFIGEELTVEGADDRLLQGLFCCEKPYSNEYPYRPKIHFCPPVGWHNDPNGMVYADGTYHLYYQWNPYGTAWGNMQWGHAKSRDLCQWEHCPVTLVPSEKGTVYSGCGIEDTRDELGYGKGTLLYYYTAAGGRNQWSVDAGNLFTQRLAYSVDGGETLLDSDKFFMPNEICENRDPKVFYHEESGAYIMLLYLDGNDFIVYRSENLQDWQETQRLSIPGMWECPDLFLLPVRNIPGMKKWVFWSADGYYLTGTFDGYTFSIESQRKSAYSSEIPYAAQTFSGTGDRTISMSWLRLKNTRGNYRGLMSLPVELYLLRENGDYIVGFEPVRELREAETAAEIITGDKICPGGKAVRLTIKPSGTARGEWNLHIGNLRIREDLIGGTISVCDTEAHAYYMNVPVRKTSEEITIIIDQEAVEIFAENGKIYGVAETEENILGMTWEIRRTEGFEADCRICYYK